MVTENSCPATQIPIKLLDNAATRQAYFMHFVSSMQQSGNPPLESAAASCRLLTRSADMGSSQAGRGQTGSQPHNPKSGLRLSRLAGVVNWVEEKPRWPRWLGLGGDLACGEAPRSPRASLATLRPLPHSPARALALTGCLGAPRPTPASAPRAAAWTAGTTRRCSSRIPGAGRAARACRGRAGERAPRVAAPSPFSAESRLDGRSAFADGRGVVLREAPPRYRPRPLLTCVGLCSPCLLLCSELLQRCPCVRAGSVRGE